MKGFVLIFFVLLFVFATLCLGSTLNSGSGNDRLFFSRLPLRPKTPIPTLTADWVNERRMLAARESVIRIGKWRFQFATLLFLALIGVTGPTLLCKARRQFQEMFSYPGTNSYDTLRKSEGVVLPTRFVHRKPLYDWVLGSGFFRFLDWGSVSPTSSETDATQHDPSSRVDRFLRSKAAHILLDWMPESFLPGF